MAKFTVRITIIMVSLYIVTSYIIAQFCGIDILRDSYMLLFELCTVIYTFSEGKYHCRYIKWTMLCVFFADSISHLDYYLDFLSMCQHNCLLGFIIASGMFYSLFLSIRHFYKVNELKKKLDGNRRRNYEKSR